MKVSSVGFFLMSDLLTHDFHTISALIRKRRTCKDFSGAPVPKEVIDALLEVSVWAPNHGLTEPWRFRIFDQKAIEKFQQFIDERATPDESTIFEKFLEKAKKAGAVIYITYARNQNEVIDRENYAACAALVQNLLLAATAQNLQSYWGTSKAMTHKHILEFLDIGADEGFVGSIWIGHAENLPPAKPRKLAREKTLWIK